MRDPRVSIILPVFNAAEFVEGAIRSILEQSFSDLELIVIDDGSQDDSAGIIDSVSDDRIVVLRNPRNLGLTDTLNRGLDAARGDYIARMDADDVSLPNRLRVQVAFLDHRPDLAAAGSFASARDGSGRESVWRMPQGPDEIRVALRFENALLHPTVMLRGAVVRKWGLRYAHFPNAEDWEMWLRISRLAPMANIPETLVIYRLHDGSVSMRNRASTRQTAEKILRSCVREFGLENHALRETHKDLSRAFEPFSGRGADALRRNAAWVHVLLEANRAKRLLTPDVLGGFLVNRLYEVMRANLGAVSTKSLFTQAEYLVLPFLARAKLIASRAFRA